MCVGEGPCSEAGTCRIAGRRARVQAGRERHAPGAHVESLCFAVAVKVPLGDSQATKQTTQKHTPGCRQLSHSPPTLMTDMLGTYTKFSLPGLGTHLPRVLSRVRSPTHTPPRLSSSNPVQGWRGTGGALALPECLLKVVVLHGQARGGET